MKLRLFFLSLLTVVVTSFFAVKAIAAEEEKFDLNAKINKIFSEAYNNEWVKTTGELSYQSYYCFRNIYIFLARLAQENINIENARVFYVMNEACEDQKLCYYYTLFPRSWRTLTSDPTRVIRWKFHVVLELNGLIYDLDFTNSAEPVTIDKYFAKMFKQGPLSCEETDDVLSIKAIPATQYLKNYVDYRADYSEDKDSLFPQYGPFLIDKENLYPKEQLLQKFFQWPEYTSPPAKCEAPTQPPQKKT